MIGRVVVAVVAVAMIAWLGVIEHDTRLQASASRLTHHGSTPDELTRAAADLQSAKRLNPDGTLDLALAVVQRQQGKAAQSRGTLDALLRREPDNLTAWGLLFVYAQREDPAAAKRALAERLRLDPLNARKAR